MSAKGKPNNIGLIAAHGGVIRAADALAKGIHRDELYALRDAGELEQIAYGVYMLPELALELPPEQVSFLAVMQRTPKAVICLESALSHHEMTTRIPQAVHFALPRTVSKPKYTEPPIVSYYFSSKTYTAGVQTVATKAGSFQVYSPEKTLADCFKFRSQLSKEMLLEALELYQQTHPVNAAELMKYARLCRVENIMRPYVDAVLTLGS